MIGAGTIAGIGTTSRIGSIAGNSSFVGYALLERMSRHGTSRKEYLFFMCEGQT